MKKKLITIFLTLAAALCLCLGLAACGAVDKATSGSDTEGGNSGGDGEERDKDGHVHVAATFNVDDRQHWKTCTVCGEKFSVGNHSYNTDNACKTCGYSVVYTKGLKYELYKNTDTYTVMGIGEAGDITELIIPAYYEGKAVTSIRYQAFSGCSRLTSIVIPESMTSIGGRAFENCKGLQSVVWNAENCTFVGRMTPVYDYTIFRGCTNLRRLTLGGNVKTISDHTFYGCYGMTGVYIADLSAWCKIEFESINSNPLSYAHHLYVDNVELKDLTIPNEITEIKKYAFYGCDGLESVTFGDSVTSIGQDAFNGCSGLTSVAIGRGMTSIGSCAFGDCTLLESITVAQGNPIHHSDGNCLIETESKTLVAGCKTSMIPSDGSVTSIGDYAFSQCHSLTSIKIPNSVTSIGRAAFSWCNAFENIVIPDSVTSIGRDAFYECSSLTSIVIPDSVTSIGDSAFYDCSGLKSVTIGGGVTSIGVSAFYHCSSLESIEIPDSVTSIGGAAFDGCSSLTIHYNGSYAQWKEIFEGYSYMFSQIVIHCTDGSYYGNGNKVE